MQSYSTFFYRSLLFLGILVTGISCTKDDNSTSPANSTVALNSTIVTSNWRITLYNDSGTDHTAAFSGYNFTFVSSGAVTAVKTGSATVTGSWSSRYDDATVKLVLAFASPSNFAELSDDWHVIERTDTRIRLQDISGGGGGTDYLTFERN